MWFSVSMVAIVVVASAWASLPLPSYVKPCRKGDPKFNECCLKHAIDALPSILKGDRKYNFPNLNPLKVEEMKLGREGSLDITFNNLDIFGIAEVVIKSVIVDLSGQTYKFDLFFPNLAFIGDYKMDAKLLSLPIKGSGPANVTILDLDIKYKSDYDLVKKSDGKQYGNPKNPRINFNCSKAFFFFDNLFNGDKLLGETTNKFINDNWQLTVEETGPSLAQAMAELINTILKNIGQLVAYEEIFPDTV